MMRKTRWFFMLQRAYMDVGQNIDGPPPSAAPQPLNLTRTKDWVDPVESDFPTSIRGNSFPDIQEKYFHDQWYIMNSSAFAGVMLPYSSEAPEDSFRFRPFPEYDRRARDLLQERNTPPTKYGRTSLPHQETFLTSMTKGHQRSMSRYTKLDRFLKKSLHTTPIETPLCVQRDVGRVEPLLPGAGTRPVDSQFPYHWDPRDLIEYERTKHNLKRFTWQDSEVTYMILVCAVWDHQAELCAEDFKTFIQSVAREFVTDRIISVTEQLGGHVQLPSEYMSVFDGMCENEIQLQIHNYLRTYLDELRRTLNKINSGEYPEVKTLEPWIRMEQFWSDTTTYNNYLVKEASTRKYEWRRYFRTITMHMPFNDSLFEKRVLDTRLWVHRECTLEYHVTLKRNIILDLDKFPVQHDPEDIPDHTFHRMFSFALDWKAPQPQLKYPEMETHELLFAYDTWDSVAHRLGCTIDELKAANSDVSELGDDVKQLNVPSTAKHKRPKYHPWLLPKSISEACFACTKLDVQKNKLEANMLTPIPHNAEKYPFEWRYGENRQFPRAAAPVPGEESWEQYTRMYLDSNLPQIEPEPLYSVNHHWPVEHIPGSLKDTPYEEDQTWMNQQQPLMKREPMHTDAWINDLPTINREAIMRSMEWSAP